MNKLIGNTEILQIADAVSREKSLPRELVIEALEDAIKVAARRKYGHDNPIRVNIDRKNGEISLYREMLVAENEAQTDSDDLPKINIDEARLKNPDVAPGDIIREPLPPLELGRLAAQSAKQVIINKVKEIERDKQYNEFKDRVGEIVNCIIDKLEYGHALVKIGTADAIIKRDQLLKSDRLKQGDKVRAYLMELDPKARGAQIILSRTHNEFLAKLFKQEVPEIYDGIIETKSVARDPGSKSKIAVHSSDSSIDPIGSCVGMRGSRVQAVINELNGEKIDIVEWAEDPVTFLINALSPTEVLKVIIDEEQNKIEAVIPDDRLSIVIGRRGQNIRLISELIGWRLDILTEENESKRRSEEFNAVTQKFMEALELEEILAQLLASEGYSSIQQLADAPISELAGIQGLDENIAEELISRAQEYAEVNPDARKHIKPEADIDRLLDQDIVNLPDANRELARTLYENEVQSLQDLADLSSDELIDIIGNDVMDKKDIDALIMQAREKQQN